MKQIIQHAHSSRNGRILKEILLHIALGILAGAAYGLLALLIVGGAK